MRFLGVLPEALASFVLVVAVQAVLAAPDMHVEFVRGRAADFQEAVEFRVCDFEDGFVLEHGRCGGGHDAHATGAEVSSNASASANGSAPFLSALNTWPQIA